MNEAELKAMISASWAAGGNPEYIMIDPVHAAMMDAYANFDGRNWRRIKREVNKAIKKARLSGPRPNQINDPRNTPR